MTTYTGTEPATLTWMADDVRQLTEPITWTRHRWVDLGWTPQRNRRRERCMETVSGPALLDALGEAIEPGAVVRGPERHQVPRSRPAANLDALTLQQAVRGGVVGWCARLSCWPTSTLDPEMWIKYALRALVGRAPELAPAVVTELARDISGWWYDCARLVGHDTADLLAGR